MLKNIGTGDRNFRIIIGVVVLAAGLYTQSWWGLIGLIPLVTALIHFCPAYTLFGMSTCKTAKVGKTENSDSEDKA